MSHHYVIQHPDGHIAIHTTVRGDPELGLLKALFAISHDKVDKTPMRDANYTLVTAGVGVTGHVPLTWRECLEDEPRPPDKVFRDAWEDCGDCVDVNMPKARGIHMDRIRASRNKELAKQDVTFMRAVEAGDTSAQFTIATEKQVLRDIPQTFDLTTDTPEELKNKWPDELPR